MRLDELLKTRGIFPSRSSAARAVRDGRILRDGEEEKDPGKECEEEVSVQVKGESVYASRGGDKLKGALPGLGVDFTDKVVLDIGASTGGFTDVALREGAGLVTALDVGRGLILPKLRENEKVTVVEKWNARDLDDLHLDREPDIVMVDVSFISARYILKAVLKRFINRLNRLEILVLYKPQFELGKEKVRKGVVRDMALVESGADSFVEGAALLGLELKARVLSPLKGPKGNQEIFLYFRR